MIVVKIKKQDEEELPLAIFCSKCRKKHPLRECPLNVVETCVICEQSHATSSCPSLPEIKVVYEGTSERSEQHCFVAQK